MGTAEIKEKVAAYNCKTTKTEEKTNVTTEILSDERIREQLRIPICNKVMNTITADSSNIHISAAEKIRKDKSDTIPVLEVRTLEPEAELAYT